MSIILDCCVLRRNGIKRNEMKLQDETKSYLLFFCSSQSVLFYLIIVYAREKERECVCVCLSIYFAVCTHSYRIVVNHQQKEEEKKSKEKNNRNVCILLLPVEKLHSTSLRANN